MEKICYYELNSDGQFHFMETYGVDDFPLCLTAEDFCDWLIEVTNGTWAKDLMELFGCENIDDYKELRDIEADDFTERDVIMNDIEMLNDFYSYKERTIYKR